jgi:hypothetical protein
MILTEETRNTWRKSCPNVNLSATKFTWIDLGLNPFFRGEKSATNRLRHGTEPHINILKTKEKLHYIQLAPYREHRMLRIERPVDDGSMGKWLLILGFLVTA